MMTMILTASAVLAAEYGIRTRVIKAPKQQFPLALRGSVRASAVCTTSALWAVS